MRIVIICLIVLGVGLFFYGKEDSLVTAVTNDNGEIAVWKDFESTENLFKVKLPSTPQYAGDNISIPGSDKKREYNLYAAEGLDGSLFSISIIVYPQEVDTSNTLEILQQIVNEVKLSRPANQLIESKEALFKGYHGLNFIIENSNFHIKGKAFMVDKIVYVLSYATRKGAFIPEEYEKFVNSFEILK